MPERLLRETSGELRDERWCRGVAEAGLRRSPFLVFQRPPGLDLLPALFRPAHSSRSDMELDHPPFDAIILGCGLAETIASACVPLTSPSALSSAADALSPLLGCSSLAHAGKTVLHVDEESYYGSDYASLSLIELVEWAQARKTPEPDEAGPSTYLCNQRRRHTDLEWSFPASSSPANGPLPDDLRKASRDYSLSLAPLLIPSVSPLIDTLVASGVSRYSTFRLLESTSIYVPAASDDVGGEARRVPGSKEDVFKDKTIGLREKRSLMKVLLWIAGEFEGSAELASGASARHVDLVSRC
jgi:hypothetical protein